MQAKDIMHRSVIRVSPGLTLRELAKIFDEDRVTGVPVVGPQGNLVGVVSQTDLIRHDRESAPGCAPDYHRREELGVGRRGFHTETPDYTKVEEVMTPWVISFEEDTPIEELARQMLRKRIHRVIITRGGKLCGIVTSMDMLRALLAVLGKRGAAAK